MKLDVLRYKDDGNTTLGLLFVDGVFECYTLEDEERDIKIKGETRIPEGTYKLDFRRELSGLTEKYRRKYDWFDFHLHVKDVPNFKYVYIHIGNTEKNTDGCLLLGSTVDKDSMFQGRSTDAYKTLYQKVGVAINKGEPINITYKTL